MKKNILFLTLFSIFFVGCTQQQDLNLEAQKKKEKINYLLETKDINNLKKLEVSNSLIQVIPVINISSIEILYEKDIKTSKNILFRNEECIFMGEATIDNTLKRINVDLKKATCKTDSKHKVNYLIHGWAAAEDETIGLKTKWIILNKDKENKDLIVSIRKGEYVYLVIDMVKQIESILIKEVPVAKKSSMNPITQQVIKQNTTKLIKLK